MEIAPRSFLRMARLWLWRHMPRRFLLPAEFLYIDMKTGGALRRETGLAKELAGEGIAIDIGANIGLYSYALSKTCRHVEAFEPNPDCAAVLEDFRAPNINVHKVALSSEEGDRDLHIPVINGIEFGGWASMSRTPADGWRSIRVPVRRLDDFEFSGVSFIKIDVEGHELEVLRGARRTIGRERPALLVEIEQRHLSFPIGDVFAELLSQGYRGYFVREGAIFPLAGFSAEQHQDEGLPRQDRPYVNNFVFIHEAQAGGSPGARPIAGDRGKKDRQ